MTRGPDCRFSLAPPSHPVHLSGKESGKSPVPAVGNPDRKEGMNMQNNTDTRNGRRHPSAFRGFSTVVSAILLVAGTAHAGTVDLSSLYGDCTVPDGTTLVNTLAGNYRISIADGATVTLDGAAIPGTDSDSCKWAGLSCLGNATIVLAGSNTVRGFHSSYPGIHVPPGKTLTFRGDGFLLAGNNGNAAGIGAGNEISCGHVVIEGGTITAAGGWGAGIGGSVNASCGNIVVKGGTVTAQGGNGSAGIGAGYTVAGGRASSCGDITIEGGTVTATGGQHGAGIGAGNRAPCGNIRLVDGIIAATGGKYAAGVGGGWLGDCGDIEISQGIDRVAATMGDSAVPFGQGFGATCGTVTIPSNLTDVTVGPTRTLTVWHGFLADLRHDVSVLDGMTLKGALTGNYKVSIVDGATITLDGASIVGTHDARYRWAGLTCEGDATIILSGANTIRGFFNEHPGIYVPAGKTLTIRGTGSLEADSNGNAAGIGSCINKSCGTIVIESGTVSARGGNYAAGIGGAYGGATVVTCGGVRITGGTVTATGGKWAAGIGCGYQNSVCEFIAIEGGTVSATGGQFAAGIGGGDGSDCGDISIGAGIAFAAATMGEEATPIGKARTGNCGTVAIAESLERTESPDGTTLMLRPRVHRIVWMDDTGGLIDVDEVADGSLPHHDDPLPTQTAAYPYRYVFTGWTPTPVEATRSAVYMATFARMADLSLLTGDWSPANGDVLLPGVTDHKVIIPAGATVTIDGVAFSSDGSTPSAPVFTDGGSAHLAGIESAGNGKWTLEAYGGLAAGNAAGVTPGMVEVYAADNVEDLATVAPLTSGVTLKGTQNAVKASLEVAPPSASDTQFFRVRFSAE